MALLLFFELDDYFPDKGKCGSAARDDINHQFNAIATPLISWDSHHVIVLFVVEKD
jgi:hypothetical protein